MNNIKNVSKSNLWCLHGNLQLPEVWNEFENEFSNYTNFHKVNLWNSKGESLWDWAKLFCRDVTIKSKSKSNILLGYSLGGRLALHALIAKPDLWKGIIIIGTDTGLDNQNERYKQLILDKIWSEKFTTEPWDELLQSWNNQSIFNGYKNKFGSKEEDFNRKTISKFFNIFSKGRQGNLTPFLANLKDKPILYISGEKDKKYCKIGKNLKLIYNNINYVEIKDAGHRAPWEKPKNFKNLVRDFISLISTESG
ncbi:MAG: hypothetical protein GY756_12115 [bacterium]|nr:hypothetical protein [bacterium]